MTTPHVTEITSARIDTSPLPAAMPAGQLLAHIKMRRALRHAASTMSDAAVRDTYRRRCAEIRELDRAADAARATGGAA